jgi:hypothetical protein
MPSVSIEGSQTVPRIAGVPRSAGTSNRPFRNENILEMVRFFQTQEGPSQAAIKQDGAMDLVKAGQRRLRLLGQAKADKRAKESGSPTPNAKSSQSHRKLVALQQAGFLPSSASAEDVLDLSRSSRTKRDVEAMGRPWLDDTAGRKNSSNRNNILKEQQERYESLSLGDFGDLAALVEFSVSFPGFEDEIGPPPYHQTQSQSGHQSSVPMAETGADQGPDNDDHPQRLCDSASVLGGEASKGLRSAVGEDSGPPVTHPSRAVNSRSSDDSGATDTDGDDAKSLAVLLRATERLERERKAAKPTSHLDHVETKETLVHSLHKGVTDSPLVGESARSEGLKEETRISTIRRDITPLSLGRHRNGGPIIPLKLVAECLLPPRVSSRTACCQPSPQSALASSSTGGNCRSVSDYPRRPSHIQKPLLDSFPRPRPQQALLSPFPFPSRRARSVTPDGAPVVPARGPPKKRKKQPPPPPYYGVADIAPPPAPTKPLPSLPPSNASRENQSEAEKSAQDTESAMSSTGDLAGTKVQEESTQRLDSPTLGSTRRLKVRKHIVPRPSSTATMFSIDLSEAVPSPRDDQSRVSTPSAESSLDALEQARRDRAERVHALRMRDLSVRKDHKTRSDSPAPSVQTETPRKDDTDTRPEHHGANRKIKRDEKYRASAAPCIPLPMDPPVPAQGTPSTGRRRAGSASSVPWSVATTTNGYGGAVSRSNSIRSGSIASSRIHRGRKEINGMSNGYHRRPSESPSLPSSDEEGVRTRVRSSPARENEERKRERRSGDHRTYSHQQHKPHVSEAQRCPRGGESVVSPVAKVRGSSSQEQSSPRSQYSHRTTYSHGSRTSQRYSTHYLHPLEARVALLERQNKMLQAALLAALDIGVSYDAECARSGMASPAIGTAMTIPPHSAGVPSSLSGLGIDEARQGQERERGSRKPVDSWASVRDHHSRGSQGSFETTTSSRSAASVRALENMLSDLDVSGVEGEWSEQWKRRSQRS